jgi:hypothetical protein
MSLSEKLDQARRRRLIAAGEQPDEDAPPPAPRPSKDEMFEPITIEVRPTGLASVARGGLFDEPDTTGHRCPSCNNLGTVDIVDLVAHRTHMTCPYCGMMWQVRTVEAAAYLQ